MNSKSSYTLIIACLLSAALVLAVAQPVNAYHLEGYRWPNQPTSGCCLSLYYAITSGTSSSSVTARNSGASALNSSAANYSLAGQSSSSNTLGSVYNSSVGWDGITNLYTSGNSFQYFHSYLNTYYTENHFTCGFWPYPDCYTNAARQSVAAHELGHVAGLDHTSACVLMDPYLYGSGGRFTSDCGYIDTPQTDDINGVNTQY